MSLSARDEALLAKYVAGELDPEAAAALRVRLGREAELAAAHRSFVAARAQLGLLKDVPSPSESGTARIMAAIERAPRPHRLVERLFRTRTVRLRVSLAGAGLAVLAAASAFLVIRGPLARQGSAANGGGPGAVVAAATTGRAAVPDRPAPPAGTPGAHDVATVPAGVGVAKDPACGVVELRQASFRISIPGATRVAVAGDFNGWSTNAHLLRNEDGDDLWTLTVSLPPGRYRYMFVVTDGAGREHWVEDDQALVRRPDGFGGMNAILTL